MAILHDVSPPQAAILRAVIEEWPVIGGILFAHYVIENILCRILVV